MMISHDKLFSIPWYLCFHMNRNQYSNCPCWIHHNVLEFNKIATVKRYFFMFGFVSLNSEMPNDWYVFECNQNNIIFELNRSNSYSSIWIFINKFIYSKNLFIFNVKIINDNWCSSCKYYCIIIWSTKNNILVICQ